MKIVVCMPVRESVKADTVQCLIDLLAHKNIVGRVQVTGTLIHKARNHLVKTAISGFKDVTHLLFVDDDMVFTNEDLDKLIEKDKGIIGSLAVERNVPFHPCVVPRDHKWKNLRFIMNGNAKEEFEVEAIGMGFTLISVELLKKAIEVKENPFYFEEASEYGEDYNFCSILKGLGETIWVHCDSIVGHIATLPVTLEHFKFNLANNPDCKPLRDDIFSYVEDPDDPTDISDGNKTR